jgi:glycerol-3-phosphate dehydrogenase (NAD(P)+)
MTGAPSVAAMSAIATILGAGAMGSAMATPLRRRGWEVRLWGTWLDGPLLAACRAGEPHPRTAVRLAPGTQLFDVEQLPAALEGADLVIVAVTSVGVEEVTRRAAPLITGADALLLLSKGFSRDDAGRVGLLPDGIRTVFAAAGLTVPPIVAVAGPCKANEVADGRPTATVFACAEEGVARWAASSVSTDAYRPAPSGDEAGVEVCAAMKNLYAIALGLADGLADRGGQPWHDLKAAVFSQAVRELTVLTTLVGGHPSTPIGLAGVGDLEVTGLSGRNKLYGVRIGRGEAASEALDAMTAAQQTVEGVPACALASDLVDQRDPRLWSVLPLLRAIASTIGGAPQPEQLITEAVLPAR